MTARERFLELMGANSPRPDARMTVENMDMLIRSGDGRMLALGMVALAEHLSEAPKLRVSEPTEAEVGMVARMVFCPSTTFTESERAVVAAAIRKLDEYRAGKRGEG